MAEQKMSREARNAYRKANNTRRRTARRKAAEERNAAWAKMSTEDKLIVLRHRPGQSKKQGKRLNAQLGE